MSEQLLREALRKRMCETCPIEDRTKACCMPDARAALAQPAEGKEVVLKVYKGDICYKSKADDQSFGMWCPVSWETEHGYPDGTAFYTAPPASQEQAACEPFGYFRPEPFGWTDCAQTDDGAIPLYERPATLDHASTIKHPLHVERSYFEAWASRYSTLSLERDGDDYARIEQTMLWHAWIARAEKANAPEGALVGPVGAGVDFALKGVTKTTQSEADYNCDHDFSLDPKSSIWICTKCGTVERKRHKASQELAQQPKAQASISESPWSVHDGGRYLACNEFATDAILRLDGDFESDDHRLQFAESVRDALNAQQPQAQAQDLPPHVAAFYPHDGTLWNSMAVEQSKTVVRFYSEDQMRAALAAKQERKPMTDEQIRSMCKQSWVFETVKQWVRIIEAHHGIVEKGVEG